MCLRFLLLFLALVLPLSSSVFVWVVLDIDASIMRVCADHMLKSYHWATRRLVAQWTTFAYEQQKYIKERALLMLPGFLALHASDLQYSFKAPRKRKP